MNYSNKYLLQLYSDTLFYDIEFSERDFELAFFRKQCSNKERVLEVACGTGRITIPLKKSGVNIEGKDISQAMINQAQLNATTANVDISFSVEDACKTTGTFDLIFIASNAFQHFLSYQKALSFLMSCKRSLTPKGQLIIDLQIPNIKKLSRNLENYRPYKTFQYNGQEVTAQTKGYYDTISQIYYFDIEYFLENKQIKKKKVAMRMYFPQELRALIEHSGFMICDSYGDYNGSPIEEISQQQIYLLQKKRA